MVLVSNSSPCNLSLMKLPYLLNDFTVLTNTAREEHHLVVISCSYAFLLFKAVYPLDKNSTPICLI